MSKPKRRMIYHHQNKLFAILEADEKLTLPEIIEGQAKGWCRRHPLGNWMLQVKMHKPQHTKGWVNRYYYVHNPKKRPLVSW